MARLLPVLALLSTGCGSTISNQIFYDDADFLNALPGPAQFGLQYPTELDTTNCHVEGSELSTFACITVDALDTGHGFISTLTTLTDLIRMLSPSERGEDYRVWGPGDWLEDYPGNFLRVEMSRSPTRSAYSWSFQLASTTAGPWESEIIRGTHYAGEIDVAAGVGDLVLDFDSMAETLGTAAGGLVTVSYDARELTWFTVEADEFAIGVDDSINSEWTFQAREDGGGELAFDAELDVLLGGDPEQLALLSRWSEFGEGRGDALVHGGDLGANTRTASQCWGSSGHLSWHTDELGWQADSGVAEDCAFTDAAFPAVETDDE